MFKYISKYSAIPIILFNEIIIPKKPTFFDDSNIDPFSSYNVDEYAMKLLICTLILSIFSFVIHCFVMVDPVAQAGPTIYLKESQILQMYTF